MPVTESDLLIAAEALRAAVQRRDGIEARIRSGDLDRDLLDRSLSAAESVLVARASWYRLMQAAGWVPPRRLVHDHELDAELIDLPN